MNGRHGVVVHVTCEDISGWQTALRNLVNLVRDDDSTSPESIHLIVNGPAARFLLSTGPESPKLSQMVSAGVTIDVCSNSLARFDHDPADLTEGVGTVQSGVAAVLRAQRNGKHLLKLP
jgi:intracellular sulfur oxidation DsrE/DsrF family protein